MYFTGKNLHKDLFCVIHNSEDMAELESKLDSLWSKERSSCSFERVLFFRKDLHMTLSLRNYNSEDSSLVTDSAKVPIVFLPAVKIWLGAHDGVVFFDQNLD